MEAAKNEKKVTIGKHMAGFLVFPKLVFMCI